MVLLTQKNQTKSCEKIMELKTEIGMVKSRMSAVWLVALKQTLCGNKQNIGNDFS